MKVNILFFGATADIAGTRHIEIDVVSQPTADIVLRDILERFPAMSLHKLKISINQQYATGAEIVRDGDELAIFTAVSGG